MVITIPDTVEQGLRIPAKSKEKELKKLLALKLYKKGILGKGKGKGIDWDQPVGVQVHTKRRRNSS